MTNKQVAQAFASGATKGRSLHVYIEGNTVYSYGKHFPIATRIGMSRVLFTSKGYSPTTARHKSLVKLALMERGLNVSETDKYINGQLTYPD